MSDIENQDNENALPVADELTTLKARADMLGITYHPSIGVEKLRDKIVAKLNDQPDPDAEVAPVAKNVELGKPSEPTEETEHQKRKRLKDEATKLIRVNITCMNPAKKEWDGEIITAGNSLVPTQRKFVPFNTTDGYHIPAIIYEVLKARQCQLFVTEKAQNGVSIRKGKLIKEFAIEVLEPLTQKELNELARRQAMAAGQS